MSPNINKKFELLQNADWEGNRYSHGVSVALIDDREKSLEKELEGKMYPCNVHTYSIEGFDKSYLQEDTLWRLDGDRFHMCFFDFSYEQNGKSAIDLRAKLLKAHPEFTPDAIVLVGE